MVDLASVFPFEECGLQGLSEDEKHAFLGDLARELELRVGEALSDGMTDVQLEEFALLIDDAEAARLWVATVVPDYLDDQIWHRIQAMGEPDPVREYAPTKWLALNRPDYRQIVGETLDGLIRECVTRFNAV